MNTRYALVALLSLVPATLFAADTAPSSKKSSPAVDVASVADDTAPTTGGIYVPKHVQQANYDGSTGFPLITANDLQAFLDLVAAESPLANCDGSTEKPMQITGNDYQCALDRFAAAYAWQQSVINAMADIN